jgi:hypothetical protein
MAALTYSQVLGQITSNLHRDDLDQVARDFSARRIDYYKKECFYEGRATNTSISTVAGTKIYNFPAGWEQVVSIKLLNGSVWISVTQISYEDLESMDVNQPSIRSIPVYWAPLAAAFVLFPAPNAIYQLELTIDLPPDPPADSASNFWTADAKDLTINGTCAEIAALHLQNASLEAIYRPLEDRELIALGSKTIRARGGINPRPYLW